MASVVTVQPQVATNITIAQQKRKEWTTGLCNCCDDCGVCWFALCCLPCFMCKTVDDFGECLCLPLMDGYCNVCGLMSMGPIPPISIAMRAAVRERYGIRGSICNDCCVMYWCLSCGWCQMAREIKEQKQPLTIINAHTTILPHPTIVSPVVYPSPVNYPPQQHYMPPGATPFYPSYPKDANAPFAN
uniref:Cornifelin-like protein b n=1 Tax=Callorhinchus milii TaxID=7868 RepID=V9LAL8_CALMI